MDSSLTGSVKSEFVHMALVLHKPDFDSTLNERIIELDHLRTRKLTGSISPELFFQLKAIMQKLESWESALIEGNKTTLDELVEWNIQGSPTDSSEKYKELSNLDEAQAYIEEHLAVNGKIDSKFILRIHDLVVKDLIREGSATPGAFRKVNVHVEDSKTGTVRHWPPFGISVDKYMEDLILFINENRPRQFQILVVALAHHRFSWIHPFDNGNGRVGRLLTYALLIKYGFNVHRGRILNPTAVFCIDRNRYYEMLKLADGGTPGGILQWCEYVASGLLAEIEKIDQLASREYVTKEILNPALDMALQRNILSKIEYSVLKRSLEGSDLVLTAGDIKDIMPGQSVVRSKLISKIKERGFLRSMNENGRKYHLSFTDNELLRTVMWQLREKGFVKSGDAITN